MTAHLKYIQVKAESPGIRWSIPVSIHSTSWAPALCCSRLWGYIREQERQEPALRRVHCGVGRTEGDKAIHGGSTSESPEARWGPAFHICIYIHRSFSRSWSQSSVWKHSRTEKEAGLGVRSLGRPSKRRRPASESVSNVVSPASLRRVPRGVCTVLWGRKTHAERNPLCDNTGNYIQYLVKKKL